MPKTDADARLLARFSQNRFEAHQVLFSHRHPQTTPHAHVDLCGAIYSQYARYLIEGFRGCAKSTWLEETAILRAAFGEFHNMVIVGASYERACERLVPIKHELEYNENLIGLFGRMKGQPWHEGKIVLRTGVCIQAIGRDQAMTGIKYRDWRPDAALVDDVEDPEEVRTDLDREKTWSWFLKTFLPALDDAEYTWVRVLGTRRGNGSLPERLERAGWKTLKLPIEYLDEDGTRKATWPARRPLDWIDHHRKLYLGDMHLWMQEYMCQATSEEHKVFRSHMIRVVPREHLWEPVYGMYDPARTATRRSATTGWAFWSWLGHKLIIWKGGAGRWLPDQMIAHVLAMNRALQPVKIGIERDGLNEWISQPLRHESARTGELVPVEALPAPRSKLDFIGMLQPYFNAGEVEFAESCPELVEQLLSYPTGTIDAPNALAFALTMRPGALVYEGFGPDQIATSLRPSPAHPTYLAGNATTGLTTAALVQFYDGQIRILADWVAEGPPDERVYNIHVEAALESDTARLVDRSFVRPADWFEALKLPERRMEFARLPLRWIIPLSHADRWMNVGLHQAIKRIPGEVSYGTELALGREAIRRLLGVRVRGEAAIQVSTRASWTLRALHGGYARPLNKGNAIGAEPEAGPYRVLMEGIEAWAGLLARGTQEETDDERQNWAYDKHGRRYLSAMPAR